jgi:hypothetical protein
MNQGVDQPELAQPFLKAYQIACTIENAELRDKADTENSLQLTEE